MQGVSGVLPFHFWETWQQSEETGGFIVLISGIFTVVVIWGYNMLGVASKKRQTERLLKKIPGPVPYPLVGNAGQRKIPVKDMFSWLSSVPQQWGNDVVRFWIDGRPKLLVNSYAVAQQLLLEKWRTPQIFGSEEDPLPEGHSLVTISADMHIFQKKCQHPDLSLRVKQDSFEIYCRHATKMRHRLTQNVLDGRPFDVLEYARMACFQIAYERVVGHEVFQDRWEREYRLQLEAWQQLHDDLLSGPYNPFKKYDLLYWNINAPKAVRPHLEKINQFGELAIIQKDNQFLTDDLPKIQGTPGCLLDLLIQLEGQELTRREVLHDLNLALLSGYDTTGPCLAWVLQLLANHPKIQNRCEDEIRQVLAGGFGEEWGEEPRAGSSNSPTPPPHPPPTTAYYSLSSRRFYGDRLPLTPNLLNNLPYLDSVITEAFRLYPAVPWHLGPLPYDISLDDGQLLPAGVDISLNSYSLHRDPFHFPDPLTFNPNRHTESSPPLLPFTTGLRSSDGQLQEEDILQLKIMLVHLLLAFHWESPSNDLDATDHNESSRRISEVGGLLSASLVGGGGSSRLTVKITPSSC